MTALRLTTWNLLHRVHAENWGEEVPARHPDESRRIQAQSARIAALMGGSSLLGLQEVSGDQLASLRATLPSDVELFSFRYPRRPRPRRGTRHRATLDDPSEHLVTLIAGGISARVVEAQAFAEDPGKGFVAIDLGGVLMINTHVSYGKRSRDQLAHLARLIGRYSGPVVLCGDFNADRETVAASLGPSLTFARAAPGSLPTRPRHRSTKSDIIDHVIVDDGRAGAATVLDAEGLSDHNIVTADVEVVAAGHGE